MSKSQRDKGAGGEVELCHILTDALGREYKRKLGQSRESGNDVDVPPFRVEVKRLKSYRTLYRWMAQCLKGRKLFETSVVALRADNEEWLVVMRLPDWIRIAREEISK